MNNKPSKGFDLEEIINRTDLSDDNKELPIPKETDTQKGVLEWGKKIADMLDKILEEKKGK